MSEQYYVVFEIVEGMCNYLELKLLTAEEAKKAAFNSLIEACKDNPVEPDVFEDCKKSIEKLDCNCICIGEVQILAIPTKRQEM